MASISDAIEAAQTLLDTDGVVGVGEGECDGRPCIVVFVSVPVSELADAIPRQFLGYPVQLREDEFTAH